MNASRNYAAKPKKTGSDLCKLDETRVKRALNTILDLARPIRLLNHHQ